MIGQVFILDYDVTYNDAEGVNPSLYVVDSNRVDDVQRLARQALENWNDYYENDRPEDSDCFECIGDEFESLLNENGIIFQYIGAIDLFDKEDRENEYIHSAVKLVVI
ncbi:MAG: hypothetical protein RSF40_01610 [Oscillospiraceae bacterium]